MLRRVVQTSVTLRLVLLVVAAAVAVGSLLALRSAPVNVLPEFKPPFVEVQTESLGLSAEEVDQLITSPLEADLLNGVAFLEEIRSESVAGLSSIQLWFEPGTDLLDARQLVQERLTEARALPNVSKAPAIMQPLSSTGRVLMVGLSSDDLSLIEQSVLARWKIKPRLLGVPGVANVAIWGQRERQLQVQVDPERLQANGVTLDQLVETTANALWSSPLSFVEASTPGTGGFIDTPQQRLGIQHVLPITNAEDLARVAMEDVGTARRMVIGDVANVTEDHQPLIGDALIEGDASLMLVVEKFPDADTRAVTEGVEDALAALAPGLPGLRMDPTLYRPASFVEEALDNLGVTLGAGAVLAFLVMALLLPWRVALVSGLAVVLAGAAAVGALQLAGASFTVMTLVGIGVALVVVVDDAVATSVRFVRHRPRRSGDLAADLAEATLLARRGLLPATLVVLVATVPLLVVGGVAESFFRAAVLAYAAAVLAAFVVAVTVTPALASGLLHRSAGQPTALTPPLAQRVLRRAHGRALRPILARPVLAWAVVAVVTALGVAVLPAVGGERLLPTSKERDVLVEWDAAPGTSLPAMTAVTDAAARELEAIDGVRAATAQVGRAVASDRVIGVHSGQMWLSIDPAGYDRTVDEVRRTLAGFPELRSAVVTYADQRIEALDRRSDVPLAVRVYGEELDQIEREAARIRDRLASVEGVVAPRFDTPAEEPTLEIEVDLARAQEFGVKPGDVRRAAATLLSGIGVGNLFEEQKVFDVVVWGAPETRRDMAAVRNLLIDTPRGDHVRLGQVADVRPATAPAVITHDSVSRYVDVVAGVQGRSVGDVQEDVEEVLQVASFPLGYHAEVLGDQAEQAGDRLRVLAAGLVALVALVLLLQAAVNSWRVAGLLLAVLPVACSGGLVAAALVPEPSSWTTLLGLLAALALAVRGGLAVVVGLADRAARRGSVHRVDVAAETAEHVTAVVTTAVVSAAALLPVVLLGGAAGLEVLQPVAVVVLAGTVTAAAAVLLVLPALYVQLARAPEPVQHESWDVDLPSQIDLTTSSLVTRETSDASR